MPELKWNGKVVGQSNTITRFVAREVGIAGKNNVEMAQCDAIVDFCSDMVAGTSSPNFSRPQVSYHTIVS